MAGVDNTTSFEDFYQREHRALYRFIYVWVGNEGDAKDVLQETFLSLYKSNKNKDVPVYERALLFRIARNESFDLLRHRKTHNAYMHDNAVGNLIPVRHELTPETNLLDKESYALAKIAFNNLKPREQECLALRRSGLTHYEVAQIMNINQSSIRQMIKRAMKRFRQLYNDQSQRQSTKVYEKVGKT